MLFPNKFKIQEIDIVHTELYKDFDDLILPMKFLYLKSFKANYEKQINQQNMQQSLKERQNRRLENTTNHKQESNQLKTYCRPSSAAPGSRQMQPAEIRFFRQVEEKIKLFKQSITNIEYTLRQQDRYIQKMNESYSEDSFISQQSQGKKGFQLIKKQTKTKPKEDIWCLIQQCTNSDFNKCDIVVSGQEWVAIIIQFQMIFRSQNQWITVRTFPFLNTSNIKYNYNIGNSETDILIASNKMLNSNIINAYMNHLMIEDEKYYFSLGKECRMHYERLYIFNSEFITDCAVETSNIQQKQQQDKHLYVWLSYLEKFKCIQYKFWLLYQRIGCVVNQNNQHWYFVQINFENKLIVIFDSIKKEESSYLYIKELFQTLFREITLDQSIVFQLSFAKQFPRQENGYSCGYFSCIAGNFLSQNENKRYLNKKEMVNILKDLLLIS